MCTELLYFTFLLYLQSGSQPIIRYTSWSFGQPWSKHTSLSMLSLNPTMQAYTVFGCGLIEKYEINHSIKYNKNKCRYHKCKTNDSLLKTECNNTNWHRFRGIVNDTIYCRNSIYFLIDQSLIVCVSAHHLSGENRWWQCVHFVQAQLFYDWLSCWRRP